MVHERDGHSAVLGRQSVGRGYPKLLWFVSVVCFFLMFANFHCVIDILFKPFRLFPVRRWIKCSDKIWNAVFLTLFVKYLCLVMCFRMRWHVPEHVIWFSPVPTLSQQLPELHAVWYTYRSSRKLHTHASVPLFQHGNWRLPRGTFNKTIVMNIMYKYIWISFEK